MYPHIQYPISSFRAPNGCEQDSVVGGMLVALLAAGAVSGVALLGGLAGLVLAEVVEELHKRYRLFARRGYYEYERRKEEARRRFETTVAELARSPDTASIRYQGAQLDYRNELGRIDEEFGRESERAFRWPGTFAWASPRAVASRERRRTKRQNLWKEWAESFAEAIRRGKEPPAPPSGRRRGNGGAPVRRLCERSSSPPPSPETLVEQWKKARGRAPAEEKVLLGSMMLDIEAAVDSSLVRNTDGEIVGRKPGVRGWLRENCPSLAGHYRMLMECRRLADDFRRAHGLRDPYPAASLLGKDPPEGISPSLRRTLAPRRAAARRLLASPAGRHATALAKALGKNVGNTVGTHCGKAEWTLDRYA